MHKSKKLWRAVRYGLLLHKAQRRLPKLGIVIMPYYWTQEGVVDNLSPGLQNGFEGYSFSSFGPEDIKTIASLFHCTADGALAKLKQGNKCFGIKYHGQIAAFMWCDFTECSFRWHKLRLGEHEVYLWGMYTMEAFRGKSIAPYLRYQTYKALKEMGRNTFYSITECFNSSSIAFKRKIGSKFLWLGVGIQLFGKVRRHWILRQYEA
jgi:ribosomal protein S18 acetylase RimI-like enzyme